ncbi:MAG: DUF5682 family protein [Clostridiales bacterium]|nr:DUF5682 family protein [Clostridiales bacterium]
MPRTKQLNGLHIFGVRHLSPSSALHLLAFLNEIRPKCVLIEGPSDCSGLLAHIADERVVLPVAVLAYTVKSPVQTVIYPLAEYSPEYQAAVWAFRNKAAVRFIDLPASVSMGADAQDWENAQGEEPGILYYKAQAEFYEAMAGMAGEHDYETFWERHFEHCSQRTAFVEKISAFSVSMRGNLEGLQWEAEKTGAARNLIREAFMKMQVELAVEQGFCADEIVVVTGAYHVKGLADETLLPMTGKEFESLPCAEIKTTLMPYSYYRLSSRSGYGAGNKAPAYFQLMWECLLREDLGRLAPLYLSSIAKIMRGSGNYNSTASAIEAVRLAKSLASLHGGEHPTLKDLHDAAVCLMGGGELSAVAEAVSRVDIGTAIGELPEGVSQTPVQDDMNRQLKALKLEKYKSTVAQDISLDLRENRAVKSTQAAFIDLQRSVFFNRLLLLGINFAAYRGSGSSTWSENWVLRWTPENEIETVEANLKGETIENAAALVLKEQFEAAGSILEIAKLIRKACICGLLAEMPGGLRRLQELCVDGENFSEAAHTAHELSSVIMYRDIRNIDTEPLVPVLQQVFLRAALVMFGGAACNGEAASGFVEAIDLMHTVSQEQFEHVNDELWLQKLRELAHSDSRNAKVSGAAAAVLMERSEITDGELKTEVSRRLSLGVPGDLAAMWFEGFSGRNRYVLLSRTSIWEQLDSYLEALDEDEFKRSLVFLRRAFSSFEPKEKNAVTDILADLWNLVPADVGEFLRDELTEEEQGKLDELNEFEFDFEL